MDRIPAAETGRRPERTAEGGDDSSRSSVFPDEPVPQIPAEPGWRIWFRAGRRVPSVWGAAPSGIYVLALDLEKDAEITVGALGERKFPAGRHFYTGRAMRGLEARLARHVRRTKERPRWHIDHLRARARLLTISVLPADDPSLECRTAGRLLAAGGRIEVPGFGSSDCACPAHLFSMPRSGRLGAIFPGE